MSRYELITRNLQEIIGDEELKILVDQVNNISIYWGTAPTGKIHLGYFLPMMKIADFLEAGCNVKILLADIHAFLDNMKTDVNLLKARTNYYEKMIKIMLDILGVDASNLIIVRGSDFQLTQDYTMDVYRLNALVSVSTAKHASAEVVKINKDPTITGLLYPSLQALDEEYLGVDIQYGGIDQRKIMMHAREYLPKLGYQKRIHIMSPMVPGIRRCAKGSTSDIESKMSSSTEHTKIDLLDSPKDITRKINKAWCIERDITDNCLLDILKLLILPLNQRMTRSGFSIILNDTTNYYSNITQIERDFAENIIYPSDLKKCISDFIINLNSRIREEFSECMQIVNEAYPINS